MRFFSNKFHFVNLMIFLILTYYNELKIFRYLLIVIPHLFCNDNKHLTILKIILAMVCIITFYKEGYISFLDILHFLVIMIYVNIVLCYEIVLLYEKCQADSFGNQANRICNKKLI